MGDLLTCITENLLAPSERRYEDYAIAAGGEYRYQIGAVTLAGREIRSIELSVRAPIVSLSLEQNYPNPFNPGTTIAFYLPEREQVKLEIFDVKGALVRRLVEGPFGAGMNKVHWDGLDDKGCKLSSGVYFYRLTAGKDKQEKKMILLR